MNMCNQQSQSSNALITSQSHGTILVMVAWFLACLLALCTAARIASRWKSQRLRHLPVSDDAIVVTASLCAIGSTVVISTAVDSGLGKRMCLLVAIDLEQIQFKIFISTVLFILALSISKCSILLFIYQAAGDKLHRVGAIVISVFVLLWTIAVMAGTVFQCEMPKPWEMWTGKCIPLRPFWATAIVVDIFIDVAIICLSACATWTLQVEYRLKTSATVVLSLRFLLVAGSALRIVFLHRAFSDEADSTFDFIPYAITNLGHVTLAIMLSCSLALTPLTDLLQAARSQLHKPRSGHCKHWSGTTVGGTPYESYASFGSNIEIIKEPLPSIQASMSNPTSPAASRDSLSHDILLPEILLPTKYTKAPPRPPPPSDYQRPDLSVFIKKSVIQEPPMVTRLGSIRDRERGHGWERVGKERSLRARGLA